MNRKIIVLLILISLPILSFAARKISLDECLKQGAERNLNIARVELETKLNHYSNRQAWGMFAFPTVSLDYSIMDRTDMKIETYLAEDPRDPGGTVIELENPVTSTRFNSGYSFKVSQTLFNGGRDLLNLRNSYLQSKIRDEQLTTEQFNMRVLVTQAYCQATAAVRGLEVSKKLVEQRKLQHESAKLRFQTGTVTRRDVLSSDVDLGRARNDSLTAEALVRQTREALNILLDFPIDTTFTYEKLPRKFDPRWDVDSLVSIASKRLSGIKISMMQKKISNNNRLAAWSNYLPTMALSLTENRSEQSGRENPFNLNPRDRSTSFGIRSSWILFNQFSTSYATQESKIRKRQAELDIEVQKNELKRMVNDLIDRLKVIYQQSKIAAKNSKLAGETLSFENERYRLGSGTVIDLSTAQVSYIEALREQINLSTEFHITLSELERGTGIILRRRN